MIYGNRFFNHVNGNILGQFLFPCFWIFFYPRPHANYRSNDFWLWFKPAVIIIYGLLLVYKIYWALKRTCYFELDETQFAIKNYFKPSSKKAYALTDIESVAITDTILDDGTLTINLKAGGPVIYNYTVLNAKEWRRLAMAFAQHGLAVTYPDEKIAEQYV